MQKGVSTQFKMREGLTEGFNQISDISDISEKTREKKSSNGESRVTKHNKKYRETKNMQTVL